MNIAMIGAGNVAWHLAQSLEKAGHRIVAVYSRNPQNAIDLSEQLYEAEIKYDLDLVESPADLVLLSVADDALEEVIDNLILPDEIILAHTSGSKPMAVFESYPYQYGVFYPLQTFSKEKPVSIEKVPFCIEACNNRTEELLLELAHSLSESVYLINSYERGVIHVAAVVACNFVNHLFAQSKDILDQAGIDFEILKPLIKETVQKAMTMEPRLAQTGPAVRKDRQVIEKHLAFLKERDIDKHRIYQLLTESILNF